MNLKDKTALITGGSKGIGKAIKECLEAEGVKVISWSRTEDVDLMKEIPPIPEVDFIIHNIGGGGTWVQSDYKEIMKKNYEIMAEIMLKASTAKLKRVIAISSIYGKEAGNSEAFTASKSAVIGYIKSCSKKYTGCTYNVVCPGFINTGKLTLLDFKKHIVGKPNDVANLVTFLCSDNASFINGAVITVDGGESHSF